MVSTVVNPVAGVDRAFLYIIGVSVALLFGITATMIAFVIRYRRGRHPVPADIRGHAGLEIAWMLVPMAIALSMFYIGWQSYLGLRTVPADALAIGVEGEMFQWTFTYPGGRQSVGQLVVPRGRAVKLNVSSRDVIHSLFIPAFRIKVDAVRGLPTYAWFLADRPGTYTILCAEYCGTSHAEMIADLRVVAPAEYEAWLARPAETPAAAAAVPELSAEVRRMFETQAFHAIDDRMRFLWRVDGPLLHVKLQAPGTGWLAVGFNPTRGMLGANFIVACVRDGRVSVADHVGTGLVKHAPDEAVGGRNDIRNAFGREANGGTEVWFSIPLDSGDKADGQLNPDGDTVVLLAYNAGLDAFAAKHTYRAAFKVNLRSGRAQSFKP